MSTVRDGWRAVGWTMSPFFFRLSRVSFADVSKLRVCETLVHLVQFLLYLVVGYTKAGVLMAEVLVLLAVLVELSQSFSAAIAHDWCVLLGLVGFEEAGEYL
jgi:uncharacterized membrane protein YGL010W